MFYMQCVSHKTHYSDHFSIFNRNHLYKMHCMRQMWEGPHLRAKSSHDANVSLGLQYALNMGTLLLKLLHWLFHTHRIIIRQIRGLRDQTWKAIKHQWWIGSCVFKHTNTGWKKKGKGIISEKNEIKNKVAAWCHKGPLFCLKCFV